LKVGEGVKVGKIAKYGLNPGLFVFGLLIPALVLVIGSIVFVNAVSPNLALEINVSEESSSSLVTSSVEERNFLMFKGKIPPKNISKKKIETNLSKKMVLATLYNENDLKFNKNYRKKYLKKNNNFSTVKFRNFSRKKTFTFRIGAQNDKIKGSQIENKNFAIDLISCNSYEGYCAFRVNGIPTKQVYMPEKTSTGKRNTFALDENHIIKINSARFNVCPNKRFCHLGYEGYHEVNVTIVRRR
jgi:hypothetical protein